MDTTTLTTAADTNTGCPGNLQWSAYGAGYPDTVCASILNWTNSRYPGLYLCDADDDFRPNGDIPCPFCDSEGFQGYLGWKDGHHVLLWAADETPVPEGTPVRFHDGDALTCTATHPERGEEKVLARELPLSDDE